MTRPRTASPISTADPFPWSWNVSAESSYAKKSVVRMSVLDAPAVGLAKIFGGREASGRWDALAWNSFVAWVKEVVLSVEQAYLLSWNGWFLNSLVQSNCTAGATTTSPTMISEPIPPAVPVVITSFGCASSINWPQSLAMGILGPSWEKWSSDLKQSTRFLPI